MIIHVVSTNDDHDLFYSKFNFGNWLLHGKTLTTMNVLETIAACDLKLGRCKQLMKSVKV